MSCNRAIITVVNSIGPTNMPLNEFVLYRAKHFSTEEHRILVLGPTNLTFIDEHKKEWGEINVRVTYCRASYLRLRRALNEMLVGYEEQGTRPIIHLHQPRSGMAVQLLNLLFVRRVPTLFTVHSSFGR